MRLSKKFVNDYTNLQNIDTLELADKMVKLGNEYESVSKLVPCTNLIIGEVVSCEKHPDSDHLHICKVNIGKETLNIVCGAPNVRTGLKVIVALDGAVLPGGTIKKTVVLGIESNGMLCSLMELGIDKKFLSDKDINGIHELSGDAPVGEDPIKYLELDDEIIDFELTANRSDELSMLGLAYECATITGEKVSLPDLSYKSISEKISDKLELRVNTDNVYTFLVKGVNNIKIEDSPNFMKNRLMACNVRSINNVVDISNYVMLETGQPLHFYDADKLGKVIEARNAVNGEKVVTLDNEERLLTSDDNNHSISLNNNSSFKINENNLSLTFKNIIFKNNFFASYDNESNITSFNSTLIDCHLQTDYANAIEVHNYGDDWGYGHSCKVSRKIKNLAFKIIGKSEGLIAAKKLTLWVRKNIKKEINAGFYQKPSKTLKRKLGNCCCKVELLLQMMDAVGLRKNHKLYFVHVGNKMYHHRHFFAMIDHICVDPTLKRPWGRGGFYSRQVVIIPYPILPLPYGHYA